MPKSTWIEVFKEGTQTSSSGITREYTGADLDTIVAMYNGQDAHEAPLVIGHPETDDPAWGWVKELKHVGTKLMAFVDAVKDEVVESVESGQYKKVSIALYPNMLLRHIGLLGAAPPAVKGLAPIAFAESEFDEYVWATDEWRVPVIGRILRNLRDFWIEKFGKDEADKAMPSYDLDMLIDSAPSTMLTIPTPPPPIVPPESINVPPPGAITSSYSEKEETEMTKEEIIEVVNTAVSTALASQEAKFSELQAQYAASQARIEELITTIETEAQNNAIDAKQTAKDKAKASFAEALESLMKEGKVLPGEKDGILEEYAEALDLEEGMEFAENQIPFSQKMKSRLEARPVLVTKNSTFAKDPDPKLKDGIEVPAQFSELAKRVNPTSIEIDTQIKAYAEEHKVDYETAAEAFTRS